MFTFGKLSALRGREQSTDCSVQKEGVALPAVPQLAPAGAKEQEAGAGG